MHLSLINYIERMQKQSKEVDTSFREYCNIARNIVSHAELYQYANEQNLKAAKNRFRITYTPIPENIWKMDLDFNPILEVYNLQKETNFVLSHWNTGPKIPHVRMGEFGFFSIENGESNYQIIPHEVFAPGFISIEALQIERTDILPTAVFIHRNTVVRTADDLMKKMLVQQY